jgi:hypothetical protein
MAITNQERVGKAMELLRAGLGPFVEREMRSVYQDKTQAQAALLMGEDRLLAKKPVVEWDAAAHREPAKGPAPNALAARASEVREQEAARIDPL